MTLKATTKFGRGDKVRGEGAHAVGAAKFLPHRVARDLILGEQVRLAAHPVGELARVDAGDARVVPVPFAVVIGTGLQKRGREHEAGGVPGVMGIMAVPKPPVASAKRWSASGQRAGSTAAW
jgi:hypothetical protein